MRTWLGWTLLGSVVVANAVVGCGGGDSSTGGFPGDDSSAPDDSSTSDGSLLSPDGTTGNDATTFDSTTGNDGGTSIDASLDIAFPDSFTNPDTSAGDASVADGAEAGCAPNGVVCNGNVATTCNNGVTTVATCSGGTPLCADGFGCVVCAPGSGSCNGSTGTVCKSDGSGYTTNDCDPLLGLTCSGGTCLGACSASNIGQSYIGCEYYAVTMTNHLLDQVTFYFSVSISNASTAAATVTITGGALGAPITQTVAAGAIVEVTLPWVPNLSTSLLTRKETNAAYRIRSTQPITVYEFNARDYTRNGVNSYTNDASLLIPVNALTGNYRVIGYNSSFDRPGQVVVIGTQDGTSVTVNPANGATFNAGAGIAANGGTVTLNRGDVIQIGTPAPGALGYGADVSGTLVTASAPVEVFGANSCMNIDYNQGYCDHIEEIVFPLETLRNDYIVALPYNENGTPQQFVKIVGTQPNTGLTFDPPAVHANQTIQAGQVLTFEVTSHFRVTGTAPIIVGQYLEGSTNFPGANVATRGDPDFSVAVATGQFRKAYPFVSPANYQQNWVNVIAPNGATVQIDGTSVGGWAAVGGSGYSVAKFQVCAGNAPGCTGVHNATSAQPFGIQVYGYGQDTSYSYPGGLDLKRQ